MTDATQQLLDTAKTGLTPWKLIQTYSPDEWELFVLEWMDGFDPPYKHVTKLAGAGDKGRDVIGYLGDPQTDCDWDNYQCKHYDKALAPTDIYKELGKLCVYTKRGDFTVPRQYRFVSPRGVGVKLHDMLKHPEKLRQSLIDNWVRYCEKEISKLENHPLTGELLDYVKSFDFKRVWYITPHELLNQHRSTNYWNQRFPSEIAVRPDTPLPPEEVQQHELKYLAKLFAAYSDHSKEEIKCIEDIVHKPRLHQHLKRSRGYFYSAEALSRFSRDQFKPGTFDSIKKHVLDGVADATLDNHADGLQCVVAITQVAAQLQLPQSELTPYVGPADKKGVCHHLANDDLIDWVDK